FRWLSRASLFRTPLAGNSKYILSIIALIYLTFDRNLINSVSFLLIQICFHRTPAIFKVLAPTPLPRANLL
ncbi:hypothetical protein, partial [Pantoea septica]|uniref:hypothetical protein n=1 Tax=Pantoea septica TaxID=472695 RepID=UPI0028A74FF9